MQSSSSEIAAVLRRLAEMLEAGGSAAVRLAGETIFIPTDADINCKYESGELSNELSVRVTWGLTSSTAQYRSIASPRIYAKTQAPIPPSPAVCHRTDS